MVDKELEKIRKQNKKLHEQWEKKVEEKATKIAYFFGAVKELQKAIEIKEENLPSDDELRKIAMFLAKAIHPNPLNKPMTFPKSKGEFNGKMY